LTLSNYLQITYATAKSMDELTKERNRVQSVSRRGVTDRFARLYRESGGVMPIRKRRKIKSKINPSIVVSTSSSNGDISNPTPVTNSNPSSSTDVTHSSSTAINNGITNNGITSKSITTNNVVSSTAITTCNQSSSIAAAGDVLDDNILDPETPLSEVIKILSWVKQVAFNQKENARSIEQLSRTSNISSIP
jgi:hypothetical protein